MPILTQTSHKLVLLLFFGKFVGMNVNMRGRLDKKRQIWSNGRQTEKADSRDGSFTERNVFRNR